MSTLALVIGNDNYYGNDQLNNAVNDAKAIKDVFIRLGYKVIFDDNCSFARMMQLKDQFSEKIEEYTSAIFYFAGHGFEYKGVNYLASIDCQIAHPSEVHCRTTCLYLEDILNVFKQVPDNINIAIIDACRISFGRGLANSFTPIHAPKGSLIAFSTSPGESASDSGIDGHSVFTGTLLQYIGRERLSVEKLFKEVRKAVSIYTGGAKTTWEHTSLTGDFYFNTGQLVHSISIPYNGTAVKDQQFASNGSVGGEIIVALKSRDWNRQNPAIERLTGLQVNLFTKDEQFLIGRNILQSSAVANAAERYMDNLSVNLREFSIDGDNHVLNGILFETYFDSKGEFRGEYLKKHHLQKVLALRKLSEFSKSFAFIKSALEPYRNFLFYVPGDEDEVIDVAVAARPKIVNTYLEGDIEYDLIENISIASANITDSIANYDIWGQNELGLKKIMVNHLAAPEELIVINSNRSIKKMTFNRDTTL